MIVDCHTHISCPSASDAGVAERLAGQQTVDKCVVLAGPGESADRTNGRVGDFVSKYAEKMVGFGFVDPVRNGSASRSISALKEKHGLKGAVVYCSACDFHPAHSRAMRLYESAQEARIPIFFHNGGDMGPESSLQYAQPYLLDEIAGKFGELKIIIGSMGEPFVSQTLAMVAKHPNVYADLTVKVDRPWQLYTTVVSAFEYGVMDKMLFGSGFPFGDAAECIEALLGFNKRLGDTNLPGVPRDQIRKIVERDSLELLGIGE